MNFTEMTEAVRDAKSTINRADNFVCNMADMIVGRLRTANISGYVLKKLKRELRDYNIHTGTWK